MPLTLKSNGSSSPNIITASWFNDFYNLLTGSMIDQPVTVHNSVLLEGLTRTNPTAPTLALVSGSGMGTGAYTYGVTYIMGFDETAIGSSTTAAITTTTGNNQVALSVIPTGPTGTTGRNIYRSKVGTTSPLFFVHTLADNTTTTYTDSTADASLGAQAPGHDSFGGSLRIQNAAGSLTAQIYGDGAILCNGQIGYSTPGDLIDGSSSSFVYYKGRGGSIIFQPTNGTNGASLDSSGNFIIANGTLGKSATSDIMDASGSTVFLKAASSFQFQVPNGTGVANITSIGFSIPSGSKYTFVSGTMSRQNGGQIACGSGTTISHGLGTTPAFVLGTPNLTQAGSGTVGVGNIGSSSFQATVGAGSSICWWGVVG